MNVLISGSDPSGGVISDKIRQAVAILNEAASKNAGIASVVGAFPQLEIFLKDAGDTRWHEGGYVTVNTTTFNNNYYMDSFDSGGSAIPRSFARTLFHEIFHGISTPDSITMNAYNMPQAPGFDLRRQQRSSQKISCTPRTSAKNQEQDM